jgi:large subunit ribosomal protein L12
MKEMEYVYSALLLHAAGKPVTEEGIASVLKAAGVAVDQTRAKALVAALQGVDIAKAIATAAVAPAAAPAGEAKKEEKKEEKKEKKEEKTVSEEEAAAGLSALFG